MKAPIEYELVKDSVSELEQYSALNNDIIANEVYEIKKILKQIKDKYDLVQ